MSGSGGEVPTLQPFELRLAGPQLIEASAGTGKTYTIGTLVLRLLLEEPPGGGEPPTIDRILVVTFTRAATAELRGRVRERLSRALEQVDGGRQVRDDALAEWLDSVARRNRDLCRNRLRAALRDFDDAAIFTIHGFCQRMLQEYAFESGVDFEAELIGDESEIVRTAVYDFWALRTYEAPAMVVAWLRDAGKLKLDACEKLGRELAATPHLPRVPARSDQPMRGPRELAKLERAYHEAWSAAAVVWRKGGPQALEVVTQAVADKHLNGGTYRADRVHGWLDALDSLFTSPPAAIAKEEREALGCLSTGHMKLNKNGHEPQHPFFVACADFVAVLDHLDAELDAWGMAFRYDLDAWLKQELPERKRRARLQSYDDLLTQLHRALEEGSDQARRLAARIRGRYLAALIDEFQDTDLVQYEIFRQVFAPQTGPGAQHSGTDADACPLLLIGDPKQAIYAFRGADVFAYLQAVESVGSERRHTLPRNYRADQSLVAALNALWRNVERPFLFREIPYVPIEAQHGHRVEPPSVPLILAYLPAAVVDWNTDGKPAKVELARRAAARAAATAVGRLLHEAPTLHRDDGTTSAITAGDVAVLVRTNKQAALMQRVLRAHHIPSVLSSEASVLDQPEAEELRQILGAMVEPANARRVRAALVTTALGQDAADLHALRQDEQAWEAWIERFRAWQDAWRRRGFLPTIQRALDEAGVSARLLALVDGERRLTNFLHLSELLHAVAFQLELGPEGLLAWFDRVREDEELRLTILGDTAQLRLESDAKAVRIATVHKAKGLEYPFVFCPFLWSQGPRGNGPTVRFHTLDGDKRQRLDIGPVADEVSTRASELEGLAEELRLLYVALTRARHGLWLAWGPFKQSEASALAYLLRPATAPGTPPNDDCSTALDDWRTSLASSAKVELDTAAAATVPEEDPLWHHTQSLAIAYPDLLRAVHLTQSDVLARARPTRTSTDVARTTLAARSTRHRPRRTLLRSSFTGLTRGTSAAAVPDTADGVDHDGLAASAGWGEDAGSTGSERFETKDGAMVGGETQAGFPIVADTIERVPLADMAAGARLGTGLHILLERIDFGADASAWQVEARRLVDHRTLPAEAEEPLLAALDTVLHTPLGVGDLDFNFAAVGWQDRINEMRYVLPVAVESRQGRFAARGTDSMSRSVGPGELADVISAHPGGTLPDDYSRRLRALSAPRFAGWLSGSLDLVFRRTRPDGSARWYLADWKSNRLGATWPDYAPERLLEAMAHHHYFLQAHLYAVALHRYLALRRPDYDYERDFGGILYVFVRGMRRELPGSGVVFDKPPQARIEALDRLLREGPA